MTRAPAPVHESASNVFADLGLPDAEAHFLKARIVAELYRLTTERNLSPAEAGTLMGIGAAEVSRLFKGDFRDCPVERLAAFLTAFDPNIEADISAKKHPLPPSQ